MADQASTPLSRQTSAGAPLRFAWQTEVSAPRPFRARAFHGESFTLACTPTQYAKPLTGLSGAAVALRWQTDGMDPDEWYEAPGAYDPATGELSADWGPDCDTGADRVRFFLALTTPQGASFRAYGALDLAPSPGFTPAQRLPESELTKLQDALKDETQARQQADNALETALQAHTKRCVPLLAPGERADPDTHGKTALVTQNGTQGGFAVSGQAGADPDSEAYVTRYQRDAITVCGGPGLAPKVYKLSTPGNAEGETVAQIQDVSNRLDVHNANKDAHQPMQDALKALIGQKADTGHTHDNRYLRLSGGTLTGNVSASGSVTIKAPILNATTYFVTPKLVNEPVNPNNHALLLGYSSHDYWEFLEYGGDFRFYSSRGASRTQVFRVTPTGLYEGTQLLADKYAAKSHTHTTAQVTGLDAALAAKADAADVYTKAEVDGKVAGVYHYKGSVANRAALPAAPAVGDVYNVQDEDGQNVAWTGSAWDALGATVDLSAYDTAQTTQGKITAAVAPKANSADVYPKAQTYTKTEVDTLVAQAVANAKAELLEQLKTLYAPLSSVQATAGGVTYRWGWDDTFQTFAMKPVED